MPDGSNLVLHLPRPGEPELATVAGMAAPAPFAMPDTSIGPVALQGPWHWTYDFDPASGESRASYPGIVNANVAPGGDQSNALVTAEGGNTPRTLAALFADTANVLDYGALGNGTAFDSAAIQAAANAIPASGGTLYFPKGTYRSNATVILKSTTRVQGDGAGSLLLADATFPPNGRFLTNANYAAASLTDHDLAVLDMAFDYGPIANGNAHAVEFRMVNRVRIERCVFQVRSSGNATGLLACFDTVVHSCSAFDFINCAYDHWDSPSKARVVNCYAQSGSTVQFVNFNPESTALAVGVASGFVLANNHFVYTGAVAATTTVEPLVVGSIVSEVTIANNIFENVRLAARGGVRGVVIDSNQFVGVVGGSEAITSYPNLGGTPADVLMVNNHAMDPATTGANVAVIRLNGTGIVANNRISGTTYAATPGVSVAGGAIEFGNAISNRVKTGMTGAFTLDAPDSTATGGNTRGSGAVDLQVVRSAATQVASGITAFCACNGNTASGNNSAVFGSSNVVSASGAFAAGSNNTASAQAATVLGLGNTASGSFSTALGHGSSDRGRVSALAFTSGLLTIAGDAQVCNQTLRAVTVDATPVVATADGAAAGAANIFNIPNQTMYRLAIRVVARNVTTGNSGATWVADNVLLSRGASAATTALSAVTFTQGGVLGTVTGWTVTAAADTTNGGITITCTGVAATTIHWAVHVESVEVQ